MALRKVGNFFVKIRNDRVKYKLFKVNFQKHTHTVHAANESNIQQKCAGVAQMRLRGPKVAKLIILTTPQTKIIHQERPFKLPRHPF